MQAEIDSLSESSNITSSDVASSSAGALEKHVIPDAEDLTLTDVSILQAFTAPYGPATEMENESNSLNAIGLEVEEERMIGAASRAWSDECILRAWTTPREYDEEELEERRITEEKSRTITIESGNEEDTPTDDDGLYSQGEGEQERLVSHEIDFFSPPRVLRHYPQALVPAIEDVDLESSSFVLVESQDERKDEQQPELDSITRFNSLEQLDVEREQEGMKRIAAEDDDGDLVDSVHLVEEQRSMDESISLTEDDAAGAGDVLEESHTVGASMEASDLLEIYQAVDREEESTLQKTMEPFSADELEAMESFQNSRSSTPSSNSPALLDADDPAADGLESVSEQERPGKGVDDMMRRAASVFAALKPRWRRD